jgi:hypothetical protein
MPWFLAIPMAGVGAAGLIKIFQSQMASMSSSMSDGVQAFAKGGDFITEGPQMIMVGDNPGGRERVQVTPLSSPNVNGNSGVTINFNNAIMSPDFTRDQIIPQIEEAVRMNLA